MKPLILVALVLSLAGCVARDDAGVRAAKLEAQDDATCKGRADYATCRQSLLAYRQQIAMDDRARAAAAEASLQRAAASLRAIDPPTQNVNVTLTCAYGRC